MSDNKYNGPRNPKRPIPDGEAAISIYGYVPSLVLAIVALATFGIAFAVHLFWWFKRRGSRNGVRTFQFLLCFGCAMEIVGYGFREASHYNTFKVINFVIQYFMIVCAPVFFTAALYLSLSIAVRSANAPHVLPISPRALVLIFVIIDIVTTALQVVGAAFIGVSESNRSEGKTPFISTKAANDILLAGLAVQSFSFLVFLCILALTALRNRRQSAYSEKVLTGTHAVPSTGKIPRRFLLVLAVTSLAIWLRTLFRLAETAEGVFGFASTNEALFGTLEYTPVIVALGIWAVAPLHKLLGEDRYIQ